MTEPEGPAPIKRTFTGPDRSYSQSLEQIIFAITDFANAIEAAAVSLRQTIKEPSQITEEKTPEVYDKLPWEDRQGSKGPYQTVNKRSCGNSDLYRHLFNVVKVNTVNTAKFAHKIGEWLYWIDTRDTPTDPTAIYRRKKKATQK